APSPECARGGKHKQPAPVDAGVGVLPIECKRQRDASDAARQVACVLLLDDRQVLLDRGPDLRREHVQPVLLAFASPNDHLTAVEIQVLSALGEALAKTRTAAPR